MRSGTKSIFRWSYATINHSTSGQFFWSKNAALQELVQRGFLVETESRHRFEHNLVRDVIYQASSPQQRQARHARAGDALEILHSERVESLAFHFDQGGVRDKALAYTLQAGERAGVCFTCRRDLPLAVAQRQPFDPSTGLRAGLPQNQRQVNLICGQLRLVSAYIYDGNEAIAGIGHIFDIHPAGAAGQVVG